MSKRKKRKRRGHFERSGTRPTTAELEKEAGAIQARVEEEDREKREDAERAAIAAALEARDRNPYGWHGDHLAHRGLGYVLGQWDAGTGKLVLAEKSPVEQMPSTITAFPPMMSAVALLLRAQPNPPVVVR